MTSVTQIQRSINLRITKRWVFFLSFHIYKNLPRIAVFRTLKCPDPSMFPLPAEVKECLQKSIRLTNYTPFNQLNRCISVSSYMLTRRFAVHLRENFSGDRVKSKKCGTCLEKAQPSYFAQRYLRVSL